jgi:hypothetical protein
MIHFNLIPKFCLAWLWRPPASYPTGTGGSFPGGKTAEEREADHSLPPTAEVENTWKCTYIPPIRQLTSRVNCSRE